MKFSHFLSLSLAVAGIGFAADPPARVPVWAEKVHAAAEQDSASLVEVVYAASKEHPFQADQVMAIALKGTSDKSTDHSLAIVKAAIDGVTAAKLNAMETLECYDAIFATASELVQAPELKRSGSGVAARPGSSKSGLATGSKGGLAGAKSGLIERDALSDLARATYDALESRILAARLLSGWDVDRFSGTVPTPGAGPGIGGGGTVSPFTP